MRRCSRPASSATSRWRLAAVLGFTSAVWLSMGACGSARDPRAAQDAGPDRSGPFGGSGPVGAGGSSGQGGSSAGAGADAGTGGVSGRGGSGTVGSSGSDGSGGSIGPTDASGGNAGAAGDSTTCPTDCDDGIPCTVDGCSAATCVHVIDPSRCAAGSYCDPAKGCVSYPACSTVQQCIDQWRDDACKSQVTCDRVSATCRFVVLDGDGDRHPPPVCGGDDCDDSRATRFPGNTEACDGVDNDCDGLVDEQATCPQGLVCRAGGCACPPDQRACFNQCVPIESDSRNCGACGNICPTNRVCNAGRCCQPDGGSCVDAGTASCNPAFCPNTGRGTPCCISSAGPCGVDIGMGCLDVRDAG